MKRIFCVLSIGLAVLLTFCIANYVKAEENYYNVGSAYEQATRFEAELYASEDAIIGTGTAATTGYTLASGSSVVEMGNPATTTITLNVNVEKEGTYVLKYAYWTGSSEAYLNVSVNGGEAISMGTMSLNGWASQKRRMAYYQNAEIELIAGANTIIISNGANYTNLDFIEIYEKGNVYYYPLEKVHLGMNGVGDRIEAEFGIIDGSLNSTNIADATKVYCNVCNSTNASNNLFAAFGTTSGNQARMKYYVNVDKAGIYDVLIASTANAKVTTSQQAWIVNEGTDNEKTYSFDLNKVATRTKGGDGYTCIQTYQIELVAGLNEIKFYNSNKSTCNIDYFTILEPRVSNLDTVFEAEYISKGIIRINGQFPETSSYVAEFLSTDDGWMTFDVNVEEDGYYDLYAVGFTGADNAQLNFQIDEEETTQLTFKNTGWLSSGNVLDGGNLYQIYLTKGIHTLTFTYKEYVTMDYFYITKSVSNIEGASAIQLDVGDELELNSNKDYFVIDDSIADIVEGKLVAKKSGVTKLCYNVTTDNGIVRTVSYELTVNMDYNFIDLNVGTRFEAEDYVSADAKIVTNTSATTGYSLASGNTIVEMGNPASTVMTLPLNVEKAGTYVLKYAYWTGSADAYLNISVNGADPVSMGTMNVNGWASAKRRIGYYQNYEIELSAGENVIIISNGNNYTNLDFVEIYEKDNVYYYPIEEVHMGMSGVGNRIEGEYGIPLGYYLSGEFVADPNVAYLNICNGSNSSNGLFSAHGVSKQAVMKYYVYIEKAGIYNLQIASTANAKTTNSLQKWVVNPGTENEIAYSIEPNSYTSRTEDGNGYTCISTHTVELVAGLNEIRYYNANNSTCNIDYFTILEPKGNNLDTVIEAETVAEGIIRINAHSNKFTMLSGYATEFHGSNSGRLVFDVTVTEEGYYDLYAVGYTGAENPKLNFKIDGEASVIDVKLSGYISSGNITSGANLYQIYLTSGTHTLEFSKSTHVTMDYFYITKSMSNVDGENKVLLLYGDSLTLNSNNTYYVTDPTIAEVVDGVLVTKKAGETTLCYDVTTQNGIVGTVSYTLVVQPVDYVGDDIKFDDINFAYDGENHSYVANIPEGWTVTYFGNEKEMVLPGKYDVTILLTHDSYNNLRFDVKVIITKTDYTGNDLIFEDGEFDYDGSEHALVAHAPEGWEISYEYNNKTYPGTVEVKAVFSHECYNDVEMLAVLTINKADYTGNDLIFEDGEFDYDGSEHALVAQAPQGWEISYENNNLTNSGTVEVKAVFSHECYNDIEKFAVLTVNKVDYTGNDLIVNDVSVEYDGLEHQVEVNVPSGWVISFSEDGIIEAGTYEITVTLSHNNYLDVVKTATLTITKTVPPQQLGNIFGCGGSVFASIFGVLALAGAAVVLRKKRKD